MTVLDLPAAMAAYRTLVGPTYHDLDYLPVDHRGRHDFMTITDTAESDGIMFRVLDELELRLAYRDTNNPARLTEVRPHPRGWPGTVPAPQPGRHRADTRTVPPRPRPRP